MNLAELRHTFSSRIRKLREGKLNQGEFADSVGVSRGAMSYYEQELRTPDIGVLRAICVKYNISADYLLGIIPDPNHSISDVCRETGLSPVAVKKLNLITRLINGDDLQPELEPEKRMIELYGEDLLNSINLPVLSALPEVLNTLLEDEEGVSLLTLLGATILGAEVYSGGEDIAIKIKTAIKSFEVFVPIDNITAALWVNIQSHADTLKKKLQNGSTQSGQTAI